CTPAPTSGRRRAGTRTGSDRTWPSCSPATPAPPPARAAASPTPHRVGTRTEPGTAVCDRDHAAAATPPPAARRGYPGGCRPPALPAAPVPAVRERSVGPTGQVAAAEC